MNLNPKLQSHGQCGAPGVRPQERPSSTDRRSARANDCGRPGRNETRWFGDPGTYELYSTCPIGRDAFISAVIPGRCNASNPESRDSGSGANAPSRSDRGERAARLKQKSAGQPRAYVKRNAPG